MKKKLFTICVAICMVLGCVLAFAACGSDDGGSDNGGSDNANGNVSGSTTSLTKEQYAQVFSAMLAELNTATVTTATSDSRSALEGNVVYLSYTVADSDMTAPDDYDQAMSIVTSCKYQISFFNSLCNSSTYTLKDTPEDCKVVIDTGDDQTQEVVMRIALSYNADTSTVTAIYYTENQYGNQTSIQYQAFDIVYDFDNRAVKSFTLSFVTGPKEGTNYKYYFEYKDSVIKVLSESSDSFTAFSTAVTADIASYSSAAWAETPTDYSEEYRSAMATPQ